MQRSRLVVRRLVFLRGECALEVRARLLGCIGSVRGVTREQGVMDELLHAEDRPRLGK